MRTCLGESQIEIDGTIKCHTQFSFLKKFYKDQLVSVVEARGDDEKVLYHRQCILRSYVIYFVYTSIFVDKSATYINEVYLSYFIDLEWTDEYSWRSSNLIYLYSKLCEDCLCKIIHVTGSCTLFTIIYLQLYCY